MIIGGDKTAVINNIRKNAKVGNLNAKVEVGDPVFSDDEAEHAVREYKAFRKNHKVKFWFRSRGAVLIQQTFGLVTNPAIKIEGIEKLNRIKNGAIVTSNHFNQLDSMCARKVIKKHFHRTPYIVIQDTNIAIPGLIGYLFNNLKMLPLRKGPNFITKEFVPELKDLVDSGEFVLIYPEEEMWYNYRKPRPCKRGTYMFAAMTKAPVIPIFVELIDTGKADNEQFNKLKFVAHVLNPIYPDAKKSVRENSIEMAKKDYEQRVAAYEKAYGKKLDYKFSADDIAGLRVREQK